MHIVVMGRRYRLRWTKQFVHGRQASRRGETVYGECDSPTHRNKEIRIRPGLSEQHEMETLLHEMLHASGWHLDEEYVERFASDAARTLVRLGFGRKPPCDSRVASSDS